ncbi:hypothetical protein ACOJBO_03950 [Rhizobium beringeri]
MRAAMETVVLDDHCIQRREGSVGLVIFERDDILLRHRPQLADQTLRDIDTEFLAMLQDMRASLAFASGLFGTTLPPDPVVVRALTVQRLRGCSTIS